MLKITGYRILDKVGEGGMAQVFKGIKTDENREIAIKVIKKELLDKNPDFVKRFKREARILSMLRHSNIVQYFDSGEADSYVYIITEFLGSGSLMTTAGLPFSKKIEIIMDICDALSYSHRKGIIHRDLKPSNILLNDQGVPKITDFGISTLKGEEWTRLTRSDMIVGTVAYMSPEQQFRPSDVDKTSDIYSLGAIMYQYFTGREAVGRFPLPKELFHDFPNTLEKIILKSMEYEPSLRYQDAGEVAEALIELMNIEYQQTLPVDEKSDTPTVAASDDFTERVGIWIQTLKNGGVQQQLDAEKILKKQCLPKDLPRLLSILKTESESVRWVLIQVIGEIGNTSAVKPLASLIHIPSLTEYIIQALGKIKGRDALEVLNRLLPSKTLMGYKKNVPFEHLFPAIINAVSAIDPQVLKPLEKYFLKHPDERVRSSMIHSIAKYSSLQDKKLLSWYVTREQRPELIHIAEKIIAHLQ